MNPTTRMLVALGGIAGCSAPPQIELSPAAAPPALVWPLDDPAAQNAACEACHPAEAAQWRASLHRDSFTNEAFQRSFAREPSPFCQACHAPHADPELPPPAWAAVNGISCVTCHLVAGAVRAVPTPRSSSPSPHPLARSAEFAGSQACAGCHEFDFPRSRRFPPGRKMQATLAEHAGSEHTRSSCADCHMSALGAGAGRDHRFDVSRNVPLLRAALTASARRLGPDRVALELAPVAVGHALPTGDLFRRLELRIDARGPDGARRAGTTRYLARHFSPPSPRRPDPLAPDDRLTGPASFEMLAQGARAEHTISWQVIYQRVDHRDAKAPELSSLAGEVVLASGELPALESSPPAATR